MLQAGAAAPAVPGVDFASGPTALFFYKVTCPVCQMAAPKAQVFEKAYPGRIVGIGQDAEPDLVAFDREFGLGIPSVPDLPPYEVSSAYGIEIVPTLFLAGQDGTVVEAVEAWDRDGYNLVAERLSALLGAEFARISDEGDGLPPYRPG